MPSAKHRAIDLPPQRFTGFAIDHFTVGRQLGWGGMGAVYLARDTSLDRPVALKLLRREMASRAEARERFVREARAQARISSPNVVQIHFVGHTRLDDVEARDDDEAPPTSLRGAPGTLYFAMEYVDGESLEAVLERGHRLAPDAARTLLVGAARGLAAAHRAGVIHRDIKPGNLLVDKEGTLKVADFGLAKPRDPKLALTRGGTILGTPHYMAPEQGAGLALDHRADMYSLGCAFFHLLTGKPPFEGPNAVALIAQHLEKAPPRLLDVAPNVPVPLAAIIDRLLQKKREDRFDSHEALSDALGHVGDDAAPRAPRLSALAKRFWRR